MRNYRTQNGEETGRKRIVAMSMHSSSGKGDLGRGPSIEDEKPRDGGLVNRTFRNLATTRCFFRRRFDGIAIKVGTVCTDLFPVPYTLPTAGQRKQTGQDGREPICTKSTRS
jgi:hypothetical protein